MKPEELLALLFPTKPTINITHHVLTGLAHYQDVQFNLIGVVQEAALDNNMCQHMAAFLLEQAQLNPKANYLVLVDTAGQLASRHAELLGLNRAIAHVCKVTHFLRNQGARIFSLVYGKALGGAFIAAGLSSEKVYALDTAQIAVMWLEAIARVTKIPLAKLQDLSKTSAIFAPGADNYVKLGALEAVLKPELVLPQLLKDLQSPPAHLEQMSALGFQRGGRLKAADIIQTILK